MNTSLNLSTELSNPTVRGLVCAALQPGLRSVLVFDASPAMIRSLAALLSQILGVITSTRVLSAQLCTTDTEESLWGKWELRNLEAEQDQSKPLVGWSPGLLGSEITTQDLRLIVIPDLTQVNLTGMRSCVTAIGADRLSIQRDGQDQSWNPNLCWIAGCPSNAVSSVSLHLLDRFSLRLTGVHNFRPITNRAEAIQTWLQNPDSDFKDYLSHPILSKSSIELLEIVAKRRAFITPQRLNQILDYTKSLKVSNPRRDLALARIAIALAQISGSEVVSDKHVTSAAIMIGLESASSQEKEQREEDFLLNAKALENSTSTEPENLSFPKPQKSSVSNSVEVDQGKTSVRIPTHTESFEEAPLSTSGALNDPYPEDRAHSEREVSMLKLPFQRYQSPSKSRGAIIGVEPARTFSDLAMVSTLIEAVKYQSIRQRNLKEIEAYSQSSVHRLIISASDFRCYRRTSKADQMLALIIDYTCLHDSDWKAALLPYLKWGYQERACVCLVQVGVCLETSMKAKNDQSVDGIELRARKISGRNILVPRIGLELEAKASRATPLAHGLELMSKTLRHALQHGRDTVQRAMLVVLSDGRGNVPLVSSYSGQITAPVKNRV